jgi:hypothetical protein
MAQSLVRNVDTKVADQRERVGRVGQIHRTVVAVYCPVMMASNLQVIVQKKRRK